jgi:hypothetical protein
MRPGAGPSDRQAALRQHMLDEASDAAHTPKRPGKDAPKVREGVILGGVEFQNSTTTSDRKAKPGTGERDRRRGGS